MKVFFNNVRAWLGTAWGSIKGWRWDLLLEILLIAAWALWMGRNLLNFNPLYITFGNEVPMASQSHYIWESVQRCGLCVLWNGSMNGGAPAFAETQGAVLHPLVILTTLFWGVVNGTKMVLLGSLILAGIAQWWLAYVMGLGRAARIWAAAVAVVAGSLLGKMDNGGFLLVLSQASASLIFAPIIGIYLHRRNSYVAWLGALLALTWLSGQGYIQVGVVMGILPALLILTINSRGNLSPLWKDYGKALILSVLLAGIFWAPLVHFFPNFVKDGDPFLNNLQQLAVLPLNLVISDRTFFTTQILGHDLNLYINYIYIGWIPVILAVLSLYFVPREKTRVMWFLWGAIMLVFIACSLEFITLLHKYIPYLDSLRYFSVVSGLVITPLLGLAAWSLDEILKRPIPQFTLKFSEDSVWSLSLKWVFWLVILITSLAPLVPQRLPWLDVYLINPQYQVVEKLNSSEAKWVAPPSGEYQWNPILLANGLKLTDVFRPWSWKNNSNPPASISILRSQDTAALPNEIARIDDLHLTQNPEVHYASVSAEGEITPCQATALGGNIDVTCTTTQAGTLTVQENFFSGWQLWVDGKKQGLISSQFLTAQAPAGTHHYQFRYRPWDVLVGLLLTLSGIAFIVYLIQSNRKETNY